MMRTALLTLALLGSMVVGIADGVAADPLMAAVQCVASVQVGFILGQPPMVTVGQACMVTFTP